MLKIYFSLFSLLICYTLFAQEFGGIQLTMQERPCPYNQEDTVVQPEFYRFFLTTDDTYDGPIDSSWCANFQEGIQPNRNFLDLTDFDTLRTLFVKIEFPEGTGPLIQPYTNNLLQQFFWLDAAELLVNQDSCQGDFCSGIYLDYDYADDVTSTNGSRRYGVGLESNYPETGGSQCFFSERFTEQRVTALGIQLRFSNLGENPRMTPYSLEVVDEEVYENFAIDSLVFTSDHFNGTNYEAGIEQVYRGESEPDFWSAYYLRQTEDAVPGPDNFRYTEAVLEPNLTEQQQLWVEFYNLPLFGAPPYTSLRGGLVAGQDSLRHELTINFSDDFFIDCYYIFVELVGDQGVTYRFNSGQLNMANANSCLRLDPGSRLLVAKDKEFYFSENGTGLFATKNASKVELEKNSRLIIGNTWLLAHVPYLNTEASHVYLPTGSELVFGEGAHLKRSHDQGRGFLYIHLQGGSVDLGNLNEEERSLIRFVYPEVPEEVITTSELRLFPNPVTNGQISFYRPSLFTDKTLDCQLFNELGQRVRSGKLNGQTGDLLNIKLAETLPNGLYFVQVSDGERVLSERVLKAGR